jgi:hypothetical protein
VRDGSLRRSPGDWFGDRQRGRAHGAGSRTDWTTSSIGPLSADSMRTRLRHTPLPRVPAATRPPPHRDCQEGRPFCLPGRRPEMPKCRMIAIGWRGAPDAPLGPAGEARGSFRSAGAEGAAARHPTGLTAQAHRRGCALPAPRNFAGLPVKAGSTNPRITNTAGRLLGRLFRDPGGAHGSIFRADQVPLGQVLRSGE